MYSKLWERIAGVRWGPARALAALEEAFSGGGAVRQGGGGSEARHMTLLLVDEIDVLITKDQAVGLVGGQRRSLGYGRGGMGWSGALSRGRSLAVGSVLQVVRSHAVRVSIT